MLLAAVVLAFTGHMLISIILGAICFVSLFAAAGISAMRPKNREQIRENAVSYGGKIHYKRNLKTGEVEDNSVIDIHYTDDPVK